MKSEHNETARRHGVESLTNDEGGCSTRGARGTLLVVDEAASIGSSRRQNPLNLQDVLARSRKQGVSVVQTVGSDRGQL